MADLRPDRFPEFFRALHGKDPFPWQQMLAARVADGAWPECIELPTAAGKTACVEIAVFALACQAERPLDERTAPRRVFFVVDRRVVVDAAFERAAAVARKLAAARGGVLNDVAERLRALGGAPDSPLVAARMRGGMARDDGWVRSPAQPAVVASTVDQVGSRLLFRPYGPSPLSASIHAALVANDSLIILDEAHCAVPFLQTARAVARYRGADWAEEPLGTPFQVVLMSATPPAGVADVFPRAGERSAALDHPDLRARVEASKPARLAVAASPREPKRGAAGLSVERTGDDELVWDAADRAIRLAADGYRRIAIMVNRVARARLIAEHLERQVRDVLRPLAADVVLMTGRMRPMDRDDLVTRWHETLAAGSSLTPDRPVIVVTTQCLEVGADFDFDALVSECASLDALRQRFGRLDRLGRRGETINREPAAAILMRAADLKTADPDPVYGSALKATWVWLADGDRDAVDMGIAAIERRLPRAREARRDLMAPMLAPTADAPIMLPAHVDCWAQTAPRPEPDPDVAVFLHGAERGEPEVRVAFRADLPIDAPSAGSMEDVWIDTVSVCPPTTLECLAVPLRFIRAWLDASMDDPAVRDDSDTEGQPLPQVDERERPHGAGTPATRRALVWRGRDASFVASSSSDIRPSDTLVVPAAYGLPAGWGHVPPDSGLDIAERGFRAARDRPLLRVSPTVLHTWQAHPAVAALLEWAAEGEREEDESDLPHRLAVLADASSAAEHGPAVPGWLSDAARGLRQVGWRLVAHPAGGYVLVGRARLGEAAPESDPGADEDDTASAADAPVTLEQHLSDVERVAAEFAARCLPPALRDPVVAAARMHDWGKADERFQALLRNGNWLAAAGGELLAKSAAVPRSAAARRRARRLSELPAGFRHELLSMQLAALAGQGDEAGERRDLVLHLIASHHGHARPLAPVVLDDAPSGVSLAGLRIGVTFAADARRNQELHPPAHHFAAGVAERFWRLTRRYGWWGVAYLEATLRLADWEASG